MEGEEDEGEEEDRELRGVEKEGKKVEKVSRLSDEMGRGRTVWGEVEAFDIFLKNWLGRWTAFG